MINNTVYTTHSILLTLAAEDCSNSRVYLRNNIFTSGETFNGGGQKWADFFYQCKSSNGNLACPGWQASNLDEDYNIYYRTRYSAQDAKGPNSRAINPLFAGTLYPLWDEPLPYTINDYYTHFYLTESSPAINAATDNVRFLYGNRDARGVVRTTSHDIGAVNYFTEAVVVHIPFKNIILNNVGYREE
jgi:hypothetical protein